MQDNPVFDDPDASVDSGPAPGGAGVQSAEAKPSLDNKDVKRSYARWAPVYDLVFTVAMYPGRKAVAAAANRPFGQVLDVGVGTGLELPMFDQRTRLVGVDLSEPMLRRAQNRAATRGLTNIDGLLVMDATNLAFPDGHFDAAVAPYVLTVVPDPEATLDELARVVKPGGEIILVNHIGASEGPIAWIEGRLGKLSAELGWRPEFPWSILGEWIDANPDVRLVERRKLAPFGLFTLARIQKL